jgi:hypothetical protein
VLWRRPNSASSAARATAAFLGVAFIIGGYAHASNRCLGTHAVVLKNRFRIAILPSCEERAPISRRRSQPTAGETGLPKGRHASTFYVLPGSFRDDNDVIRPAADVEFQTLQHRSATPSVSPRRRPDCVRRSLAGMRSRDAAALRLPLIADPRVGVPRINSAVMALMDQRTASINRTAIHQPAVSDERVMRLNACCNIAPLHVVCQRATHARALFRLFIEIRFARLRSKNSRTRVGEGGQHAGWGPGWGPRGGGARRRYNAKVRNFRWKFSPENA